MPFIDVKVNCGLEEGLEKELKAELGKAIALIPGKSEGSLMVRFTDHCRMWFGGEREGVIVMVNVMVYGASEARYYEAFKNAVIPLMEEKLGARQVYLKFEETPHWYWN